ncbi:MAG: ABC transporter [Alteromonadaceae bacterium]|nr:ABC transporter [Alteromonadaceae bacterium]
MKLSNALTYILLVVAFFAATILNNTFFKSARLDLTENQVYSLSSGSKEILQQIDEPIQLYFFYSNKASEGLTTLRNYADRVLSLLREYESSANGKLKLHIIDPEPFSEAEDQADEFGLTAASSGVGTDSIYLGLAGRNALDDEQIIGFFDPQKEQFLEYDITKMIYQLSDPTPLKMGLLSSLTLSGGQNPMTGQFDPAWTLYTQIQQLYSVEDIPQEADALPEDIDVLMLIHPIGLSEKLLYQIDQFAMGGGKILAFVDPHHESDPMAAMGGMTAANSSEIDLLLKNWGVQFTSEEVLLDAALGLDIRTQTGGITKHLGFVGLQRGMFDETDVTTANLDSINGASFGVFTELSGTETQVTPLIVSSDYVSTVNNGIYSSTREPEMLFDHFTGQSVPQNLAVRLSGKAISAFDNAPEGIESEHLKETQQLNAIIVGDTDFLTDRFWVNQANFFGQTIVTPFADNGAFVTNALENLGGNNSLISIRSRGTFARPFERVEALTVLAEERFREQEMALEQQLAETETQLSELQNSQGGSETLVLTAEQQQAIDSFMDKKIEIRKKLREVRHQLDKDIEDLGSTLKFINIFVMPLLLVLGLFMIQRSLRLRG